MRWWVDIQAILETIRPRVERSRFVYHDVERGRRLVVEREGDRIVVVPYYPRRFRA